ncbi:hypothetical protein Tco_0084731 [Tanacetum coccineum]
MNSLNSQMHNDIMAAGSKERPPMLALGKAMHMILNGIGNDIYSTMDACPNAKEMWIAIEQLQQGESNNIQDVKTNLFWEFGKFTSRDEESVESYYTRFYRMMNEMVRNKLKVDTMSVNVQFLQQLQPYLIRFLTIVKQAQDLGTVSYHKLFDLLKQHQNEVNEIRAERITRNANPIALVVANQNYLDGYDQAPQVPKPYKTHAPSSRQTTSTRSHATTRSKGKDIVKPPSPPSELASKEDSDEEQAQRNKQIQKRPTYDTKPLEKVHPDDDYNVFATERQHPEQPESINDTYVMEKVDSNVSPYSSDMSTNE